MCHERRSFRDPGLSRSPGQAIAAAWVLFRGLIDTSPAKTLEDAAVKLRRLEAYVDKGQPARLLAGALSAVERAVLTTAH